MKKLTEEQKAKVHIGIVLAIIAAATLGLLIWGLVEEQRSGKISEAYLNFNGINVALALEGGAEQTNESAENNTEITLGEQLKNWWTVAANKEITIAGITISISAIVSFLLYILYRFTRRKLTDVLSNITKIKQARDDDAAEFKAAEQKLDEAIKAYFIKEHDDKLTAIGDKLAQAVGLAKSPAEEIAVECKNADPKKAEAETPSEPSGGYVRMV
ncbi:MAG: hypothetical protein LBT55_01780 [Clostridiaceae bacterium]|jgi:hypothetical protein|nr:hypothetical protein [Clostridiaceae bacterium]